MVLVLLLGTIEVLLITLYLQQFDPSVEPCIQAMSSKRSKRSNSAQFVVKTKYPKLCLLDANIFSVSSAGLIIYTIKSRRVRHVFQQAVLNTDAKK
jgi:hypothetical protein